jgi:hypothetical protein
LSIGDEPFNFPLLGASNLGISPLLFAVATGSAEFSLFLYKNATCKYAKVLFLIPKGKCSFGMNNIKLKIWFAYLVILMASFIDRS